MKSGWVQLLLILLIFAFGALFGVEAAKNGMKNMGFSPDGQPVRPDSYYVARVENGTLVVLPNHQAESLAAAEPKEAEPPKPEKEAEQREPEPASAAENPGAPIVPVLSKEGFLSRLGEKMGERVSRVTRHLLEVSLSRIFD